MPMVVGSITRGMAGPVDDESIGSLILVSFLIFTYPDSFREPFGDALKVLDPCLRTVYSME